MPEPHAPTAVDVEEADPKSAPTLLVGAVGLVLLMVLVLLVEVLYQRTTQAETYRKVIAEQPQELRQVQASQLEQINTYRWIDASKGIAAVPIDRAIDLVVQDAREGKQP